MYSQFRAQYPMGSLTSEVLKAEPDHYVVRALVQVGETTLATGLSAASTMEAAEDHARLRALVVLGIEPHAYDSQAHLLAHQNPARLQPSSLSENLQDIANRALDAAPDWEVSTPRTPVQRSETLIAIEDEDILPKQPTHSRRKAKSTASKRKTAPSQPIEPPELGLPTDLSDIIAQTDVELKRLGWSNTQGRRHLQQTYNKRSRQHLTDQELLEFLDFLQSQANVEEAPF